MFPEFIREQGSGTVVTFLGNAELENTFVPPGRARGWLFKYLHQRFFRFSDDGIEVVVRVPSGDEEDWPTTLEEASERQRGSGKSFNLSRVRGTAHIWDEAADRQGEDFRGTVELAGDASADIPAANMHWWVLPTGPGTDVSTRTAGGGSLAVLFQNELHDWRMSNQANPFFARLGILFGKPRITFVLEPLGGTITSDFARAHVLVGGRPVFEADAWHVWSEQFRAAMPDQIKQTMLEEQARLQAEDPDRARRIRERLKDVMSLLRPRRFRRQTDGQVRAGGPTTTGPDGGPGSTITRQPGSGSGKRKGAQTRGIGAVLSQVDQDGDDDTSEVYSILSLNPVWVTEAEAETMSHRQRERQRDPRPCRSARRRERRRRRTPSLLNREFRGYQTILAAMNDWANPDGDDDEGRGDRAGRPGVGRAEDGRGRERAPPARERLHVARFALRRGAQPRRAHGRLHGGPVPHAPRGQARDREHPRGLRRRLGNGRVGRGPQRPRPRLLRAAPG